MEFNDLRDLAFSAAKAQKGSDKPAYTFSAEGRTENWSTEEVNNALRAEFVKLIEGESGNRYAGYRQNKNIIFQLIEETIDEVLPQRVLDQYMDFAEVKVLAQGDKAVFKKRVSEAARKRAKTFVTAVGLAGRYETFMLDGFEIEVQMGAIGAACKIGFEEFLDGRIQFSELTSIILEGMDEYIYKEVAKALASVVENLPNVNKAVVNGFDEKTMDELLAISDSYGKSAIYCTFEFAATMKPVEGWASGDMKSTLWNKGWLDNYKGHTVVILPQSIEDETNATKVIDPAQAYIIPVGSEKPVKLAFEGPTCVRDIEDNDDWSHDLQTYKKFGIATFTNHWMCSYRNTNLVKTTRTQNVYTPAP